MIKNIRAAPTMHYILKQYHYLWHPNYIMANHYGWPTKSNHFLSSGLLTPMIYSTNLEELSPFSHLCVKIWDLQSSFTTAAEDALMSYFLSLADPALKLLLHVYEIICEIWGGKLGQSCSCRKYVRSIATFPKFGIGLINLLWA